MVGLIKAWGLQEGVWASSLEGSLLPANQQAEKPRFQGARKIRVG